MKLICAGVGGSRCLVLRFRKANILLDCAVPLDSALYAVAGAGADAGTETAPGEAGLHRQSAAGDPAGDNGLLDLTPFLSLLHTLELHAALISSAEALLALPHLLSQPFEPPPEQQKLEQAAIDAAEQLVAERWAAAAAINASRNGVYATGSTKMPTKAAPDAAQAGEGGDHAPTGGLETDRAGPGGLPSAADLGLWDLPDRQAGLLAGSCWRRRPSLAAVRYVLDRVRPVRYGQVVPLDDYELTAAPYPCGSGFGHAAWQIMDGAERCRTVLYLPNAAPSHAFAPQLPLALLRQPDALLLGPHMLAAAAPAAAPPPPAPAPPPARPGLAGIKEAVLGAVTSGGVAVLPVHATGDTAWELLEALAASLASADLADSVPLMYTGPRARTSLALASVSLEALGPDRQAAVYRPAHPFAFDALLRSGRLVVGSSLADPEVRRRLWPAEQQPGQAVQQRPRPAVVLVSANSLLHPGGDGRELLLRLGPDPHSVLILPHAAAPAALRGIRRIYTQAAAAASASQRSQDRAAHAAALEPPGPQQSQPPPLQPLRMRLLHLPLHGAGASSGPSPGGLLDLLQLLQPRHLLLSSRDHALLQQAALLRQQQQQQQPPGGSAAAPPQPQAQPPAIQLARESVVPYGWLCQVAVSLPRNVHGALVSPDLLARLQWLGAGPGLQVARLNCVLVFRGGAWHADPVPGSATSADSVAAAVATAAGGAVAADQLLLLAAPAPPSPQAAARGSGAGAGGAGAGASGGAAAAATVKAEAGGGAAQAALWTASPELGPLLAALSERGVTHVGVEVDAKVTRLAVNGTDAVLELRPGGAHIHTACPVLRQVLTDCLMRQLTAI
ncbi:hypothetical protein HXX76_000413 [Chlamydomonas incerta]|uniref:Beta-Casp domain-containing protein n=1 Tax=Chlamydomonas incerta TaxID=51695 RepID=A0A836B2Z9_CHLIN|nr:hypothetical protein HXX76_000413 [Chlamydomonas incerta]|eukprot:KAG2445809.1 hypothetical protein HXX76_000413 [Chlamydomonas incerta]